MAFVSQCSAKPKDTPFFPPTLWILYSSNTGCGGLGGVGGPLLSASYHSSKKAFVTQDTQSGYHIKYSKSSIRNDQRWDVNVNWETECKF